MCCCYNAGKDRGVMLRTLDGWLRAAFSANRVKLKLMFRVGEMRSHSSEQPQANPRQGKLKRVCVCFSILV